MATVGGEKLIKVTEIRRNIKSVLDELGHAGPDSRVVLMTHGEPVAVLQDYAAYQAMLDKMRELQLQVGLAEARRRAELVERGEMETISLADVAKQDGLL